MRRRAGLLLMPLLTAAAAADQAPPWHVWTDPLALATYRDDHTVVVRSSSSPDACRYDAAGQVVSGALGCRYDHLYRPLGRHRYLRDEGGELVLLDERGAGALVRMWLTTGDGYSAEFPANLRLRLRLDGDPIPYVDLPVRQWFDGSQWPFLPPLVGDRASAAGASYGYVPIAFRERIQLALAGPAASIDAGRIWYQFTIQRQALDPAGTASGVVPDIDAWRAFVAAPAGSYPWPTQPQWQAASVAVPAGGTIDLADTVGAGALLGLRLRPAMSAQWPQLRLTAVVDGDPRIDLPLAQLFGLDLEAPGPVRGLVLGQGPDGFGYLYLPQPYSHRFRLRLANTGSTAVALDAALAWTGPGVANGALRLGAVASQRCIDGGRDQPDLPLLALSGRGRWLGLVAVQGNLALDDPNYLEGDERLYLDGSAHPAWYGTGTEDFYNGGFYFDRAGYGFAHALALAGAPWHRMLGAAPVRSRMYRMLLADAAPFHSQLDLRLERGAYGDQPMCSDTVAWYYGEPARGLAPVASVDLADPASVAAAGYQPPVGAECAPLTGAYADEPATVRTGRVCRYSGGGAGFGFALRQPGDGFWLRRRFDGQGGGQAATLWVDGAVAARLPYAMANAQRRWQEVEVPLALGPRPAGAVLALRVVPDDPGAVFTDAHYVLLARATDALFADGFQAPD